MMTSSERNAKRESRESLPDWRCVAASVRGSSHERASVPCQDAHCYHYLGNGILLAAVADGAGSATRGELGARIAADYALEALAEGINSYAPDLDDTWREVMRSAAASAKNRVVEAAQAHDVPERELASTLILAAAFPGGVAAAQIGDGAAVVRGRNGDLAAITTPHNGEYPNETTFLTSLPDLDTIQLVVWRGETAEVALFSDGLQSIALSTRDGSPHAPFFDPLFRFVAGAEDMDRARTELDAFLRSPRFEERTDDDLTLVLAALTS